MPSSPKIIVLKSREIVYTLILIFLAILLILCMVLMFTGPGNPSASPAQKESSTVSITEDNRSARYTPGIYTSAISLGGNSVNVEITVDKNNINNIQLTNLSTAVTASFPLIAPAFDHLTEQILEKQSMEQITCSQENRYTSQLLFSAIEKALNLASASSAD